MTLPSEIKKISNVEGTCVPSSSEWLSSKPQYPLWYSWWRWWIKNIFGDKRRVGTVHKFLIGDKTVRSESNMRCRQRPTGLRYKWYDRILVNKYSVFSTDMMRSKNAIGVVCSRISVWFYDIDRHCNTYPAPSRFLVVLWPLNFWPPNIIDVFFGDCVWSPIPLDEHMR